MYVFPQWVDSVRHFVKFPNNTGYRKVGASAFDQYPTFLRPLPADAEDKATPSDDASSTKIAIALSS